jgi:hypothetical protein
LLKPYLYTFDVKLLTKGSDFLTYQDNTTVFRHDNYLQYVLACAMKWYDMYIICIEINKHRMIIYKKLGRDDIRKKKGE